jgi:hypothetical protein
MLDQSMPKNSSEPDLFIPHPRDAFLARIAHPQWQAGDKS